MNLILYKNTFTIMKSEIIAWNRAQWRHQLLRNGCGTGSTYCRDAGTGWGVPPPPPLCVQMDFTRTFEANTKCNNINYVWSHFYQILVVLKYHRRLWNNIFNTDISRSINIPKNAKYTPLMWVFMHLKMSVSKILFHRHPWYFTTTKVGWTWL